MQKCLGYFMGIDRTLTGYEGLIEAQQCLPNNDVRDAFAVDYNTLANLWETLSPDLILLPYETDYRWLSQVYVSVQPTTGHRRTALGTRSVPKPVDDPPECPCRSRSATTSTISCSTPT